MMEDVIYAILFFGGGTLALLAFSPIGRALADRIRHGPTAAVTDPAVQEELALLRDEVAELHERMDFTERMLAQRQEPGRLSSGS